MKKPITDEKFYITDIPKDKEKIRELISFLGDSKNWKDLHYDFMIRNNYNSICYDIENKDYTFDISLLHKNKLSIAITYDDLMDNYLPKDTALNEIIDETLKEVTKNEDKLNKVKNPNATHYEIWNGFEAIDIIKNTLSKDEYIGYLKGNILKYQLRVGKKTTDYEGISKDLEKLKDYQNELNEYWIL